MVLAFRACVLVAFALVSTPQLLAQAKANELRFAVGTWLARGSQSWSDGTRVRHKGIVEGRLAADGVTLERVFWGAFDNGHSLAGRSVHVLNPADRSWVGRWLPSSGTWDATPAIGRLEGDEYVEVGRGKSGAGKFTSKARFFDISSDHYTVRADLFFDSGKQSRGDWVSKFVRIPDLQRAVGGTGGGHDQKLVFLLGKWVARGVLVLPDGSQVTHTSYVEARLGDDGVSIDREYWGALSSGAALRGRSTHAPVVGQTDWESSWTPIGSAVPAVTSRGRFEADEFVERHSQPPSHRSEIGRSGRGSSDAEGSVTVVTRYFEITPVGYRVQTALRDADGAVTKAVWTACFRRIP